MTESKRVKVKLKNWVLAVATVLIWTGFTAFHVKHGMFNLGSSIIDLITITAVLFIVPRLFPICITKEGIVSNRLLIIPILVTWGEVDFDKIKRNKFLPYTFLLFSWWQYRQVLFPGLFYIANSVEVLTLIERYTRKYRS